MDCNAMCLPDGISYNATGLSSHVSSFKLASPAVDIVHLQTVDSVDATILVDNSIDILLQSTGQVARPPLTWDWSERPQLRAEHGYSLLFKIHKKGNTSTILYDTGLSPDTILHNIAVLGIKLTDLDA